TIPCQSPDTKEFATSRDPLSTPCIRFRSITVIDPPQHGRPPPWRSPLSNAAAPPASPRRHPAAKAAAAPASCQKIAASYDEPPTGPPPARPRRGDKGTPCPPAGAAHTPSVPGSGS